MPRILTPWMVPATSLRNTKPTKPLSSFFGNYLSGFLGTFYETMPKQGFFTMLLVLGVVAGIAISLVNRPLHRIVGRHE